MTTIRFYYHKNELRSYSLNIMPSPNKDINYIAKNLFQLRIFVSPFLFLPLIIAKMDLKDF